MTIAVLLDSTRHLSAIRDGRYTGSMGAKP